jgi:hypothetical protein
MRGTKAKKLMRLVKNGFLASGEQCQDDEQKSYWYKMVDKVVSDKTVSVMGSWFRHPKSVRAQYQRAKTLYKRGMLNL